MKYLLEGAKVICSLIASSIKEVDCFDVWKFVAWHYENGSSNNKGTDFDQSYSPVARAGWFRINIAFTDMHRLTARILDVIKSFYNKNFPFIKE